MKRNIEETFENSITNDFLNSNKRKFNSNIVDNITKNSVNTMGARLSCINSEEVNKAQHIFLNTVKKENLKATNQGSSGRCWMFAGLNVFRHIVVELYNLEQFEFSETYLYFYDKLERSNTYLQWYIDNYKTFDFNSRITEYMFNYYMGDGGYWSTFANLVEKYGLVPKSAMPETYQSNDSEDMNMIIMEDLQYCISKMYKTKNVDKMKKLKEKTMENIYKNLVKFLGEPPKNFTWIFKSDDNPNAVTEITPLKFKEILLPGIDIRDFVLLSSIPTLKNKEKYEVEFTSNIIEGENNVVINLPLEDLKRTAKNSILSGFAVWFAADVIKKYDFFDSVLSENVIKTETLFGEHKNFSRLERIKFGNIQSTHAMVLTGVNLDQNQKPLYWQVENSWGYWDNEVDGQNGFLSMNDNWWEYITEIVVHKKFISRSIKKVLKKKEIPIKPWDNVNKSLKVNNIKIPFEIKNRNTKKIF